MTNEQKTDEICKRHIFDSNHFDCCMQMAQWKDEQHVKEKQKLIEEACKWWEREFLYPTMAQAEIDWYQTKIAEFKQAMKKNKL